ncbi:MAG: aldolase [Armatimonadetes bacterium CG_4_10_14_3_um_filter_66_18]|nr:aldolase [Armatimonadota bacterium]OIO94622.1 MAG: aldolase [Armatimonadetes bacterium CG2_30_66_41]PIU95085.1 MAG: aldolase [Armatimonadetes bacterium CG06_land_8_20_14_3_00_66_21]PIX41026.1 MAG: aldolase [Armatimonadetes bacterium CG_4_8_14_3_um_filter_66_20]PIY51566.1 MAG: aldolase [Armatimonadetes bacterium CG_4_10_14_3_um_filter_66_18]PIZ35150.1 MAG: aldolase [Armatimonadetes bacterium CG_4_10_14_0_8_um_filter_66_14]PJB64334.1 MAG: aldolase [Armatimonadetes bacterium CG_4_9_14_3_um_fi
MNGQQLVEALHSGQHVYGTMIISPAPEWPAAVSQSGVDFVFIDTEHTALDRAQVSWMCRAYSALNIAPVVRIPSPDPFEACKVLDGGAGGVIAPYIETPEQVRALVGAVKYRPLKGKRLTDFLAGTADLEPELKDYLDQRNASSALVVNIESVPAMNALDDILAVPGLDAVLIGPHDLSCSLGLPEQYDHPPFKQAVTDILTRARAAGIGAGMHVTYEYGYPHEIAWAKAGANLLVHSGDVMVLRYQMRREIEAIRAAVEAGAA